ncbi:Ser/Thr protein kinase RdoA (MazF antagonist) [Fontibacillus phaseoli]|uniref:Ser/Thr protein kinase RdoA (MazF antagonist) n=1 Tax=Fontibacillus phaseoli TaxID=1416533 RepID=A0A369BPG4_9BACL|nr:phosphotransferase [Fontibacillus phaseoli]RCX23433.1 Ser/Thr protein kinase RdoA (MazF antagonist) [Fontibacillus phaseoli]
MSDSMVKQFWPEWNGEIREGASGWNNTTRYIENKGLSCVLRIYESHRDRDKIQYEHEVLSRLQEIELSFKVPQPVRTPDGETILQMGDGSARYACLFEYIEGALPKNGSFQAAHSFGQAVAELVIALAKVKPELSPSYRPYYELQQSYPSCSYDVVRHFCEHPPEVFRNLHDSITTLGEAYDDVCDRLEEVKKLPRQLVHGDLNPSNLLVDQQHHDQIAALLDFEFCTLDVRAMEPAVVISDLLGYEGKKETIREFCVGFGSLLRLKPEEISHIPTLIRLRKVDVFLHFMSRYLNGTDGPDVLRVQSVALAAELKEFGQDEIWIREILREYMLDRLGWD